VTREQMEARLIGWKAMYDQRDSFIREAHTAGVTITRIHALTGISRATIYRILEKE
jgi:predicted DNA-binding transcriptional regulator AlpA